jgi:hypothetical protein
MGEFAIPGAVILLFYVSLTAANIYQCHLDNKYHQHPKRKKWSAGWVFHRLYTAIGILFCIDICILMDRYWGTHELVGDCFAFLATGLVITSCYYFVYKLVSTSYHAHNVALNKKKLLTLLVVVNSLVWFFSITSEVLVFLVDSRFRGLSVLLSALACLFLVSANYYYSRQVVKQLKQTAANMKLKDNDALDRFNKTLRKLFSSGIVACVSLMYFAFAGAQDKVDDPNSKTNTSVISVIFVKSLTWITWALLSNIYMYRNVGNLVHPNATYTLTANTPAKARDRVRHLSRKSAAISTVSLVSESNGLVSRAAASRVSMAGSDVSAQAISLDISMFSTDKDIASDDKSQHSSAISSTV